MKLIQAIIQPHKLDAVKDALGRTSDGMTVTEVQGYGRQKGHSAVYRGAEYIVDMLPKLQVEVAVHDDLCERVVDAISEAARTGKVGDGKIFVYELPRAVRIRTEEIDEAAL